MLDWRDGGGVNQSVRQETAAQDPSAFTDLFCFHLVFTFSVARWSDLVTEQLD